MKKIKTQLILVLILAFMPCTAQESQTIIPKVENHLKAELDYAQGALDFEYKKINGERITIGKINTDGTIEFNLPDYDIKAIHDSINLAPYKFHHWFSIDSNCKDRDSFEKTPFDDVYSNKINAMYIKKYGIYIAVLEAVIDEDSPDHKYKREYFWLNVDRALTYNENCTKISNRTGDVYNEISANLDLKKGWNLIEGSSSTPANSNDENSNTTQLTTTKFTRSSPSSPNVKWTLRQIEKDEKIEAAKRLDVLIPLTKNQFEKWAPNKTGDLKLTFKEHGNPPKRQKNKNNLHLTYADKAKTKEIDLYVIDAAKSPDDMEMINFAYAMENDGKEKKDIKPYVSQYNESIKTTQLLYRVEDRIIVNASSANIKEQELWGYIQKLNLEKLLKK